MGLARSPSRRARRPGNGPRAFVEEGNSRRMNARGRGSGKMGLGPAQGFYQVVAAFVFISDFKRSKVMRSISMNWIPCMYKLLSVFLSCR